MCSWCWGFSPVKAALTEQCRGRALVTLIVGGLHTDWTEPQDTERKDFLRHHWDEVHARTGQPFTHDLLERDDFVYNTEAACRAAVTVRELAGNAKALDFFSELQRAFYVDNADVTQAEVLTDLAVEFGIDGKTFAEHFASEAMRENTLKDFQMSRHMGINGFPTVVVNDAAGYAYLTVGYQPLEALKPVVEQWLEGALERQAG